MKIAILGAGAMGGLFSAYLSRENEVTVIDVNTALVDKINTGGIAVEEKDGTLEVFHPTAAAQTAGMGQVDLVVLFVKSMFSEAALAQNRAIIGEHTYLLTLQNGSGHEEVLHKFADDKHVVIGATQHNASIKALAEIRHGGSGNTVIGCPCADSAHLQPLAAAFSACGIACGVDKEVQTLIWNKMFTNVSVSALTGALQMPIGFILSDPHAWAACTQLVREAVDVAAGLGIHFDFHEKLAEVKAVCEGAPNGLTSIYADLRDGRRTEVDTISGSVVRASEKCGVPAPGHALLVQLIHAMEGKNASAAP